MAPSIRSQVGPLIAVIALVLAACSSASGSSASSSSGSVPGDSGIEGITEADPQCPVVSANAPCPAQPISKTVVAHDPTGKEVARFTSAADGTFRVALSPGSYRLEEVVDPPGSPPNLKPESVEVLAGKFTHVALIFDTGIR
ncbi:MAG: hypothetical protein ABJC39_06010 [Chloroflexota bacterium]